MKIMTSCLLPVALTSISCTALANENNNDDKIGLDLFATFEGSLYNNFKLPNVDLKKPTYSGSLQLNGLYSLNKTDFGSIVVGGGLEYYGLQAETKKMLGNTKIDFNFNSVMINGIAGYKFTPTEKFSIYTLANVGYGVSNSAEAKVTNDVFFKNVSFNSGIDMSNHFSYGANAIGAYNFNKTIGLGLGFGATGHSFNVKKDSLNYNENVNYVDVNSSLSLIISI